MDSPDFTPLILGAMAIGFASCLIVIGFVYALIWIYNHVQII